MRTYYKYAMVVLLKYDIFCVSSMKCLPKTCDRQDSHIYSFVFEKIGRGVLESWKVKNLN